MSFSLTRRVLLGAGFAAALAGLGAGASAQTVLRYGHNNSPDSVVGQQADWLAEEIAKNTNGSVEVEVYPASQLGKLQELAEAVSLGTVALSHNTAGAYSTLYEPLGALDTPYLYRDVDHLMKVMDVDGPVMTGLNEGLIASAGVRVLYAFYFGARQLTANEAFRSPSELAGEKIRAVPFPIYLTAVEGLGAAPVPVDWSEVPTALATGVVAGQENPVNIILSNKLFDVQSHLMLTGHIASAELVVINEDVWQSLTEEEREGIRAAASTVRDRATAAVRDKEAEQIEELKAAGMTVIGPEEGLDIEAFRASVQALVHERFDEKYGDLYAQIDAVK
ncbi:TRAP transporter substrate-binding protein [Oceanicella sp. SM1341]|uniref:TRAP transporter substrate-binding protein n=1 Tax=Oceanicella sp. SM1341 TaxID=1548889 RepID=UPI000E4D2D1B|nr:TRAP transporter substrate-binding protein [Oceanicella sp. SM1341]